MSTLDTKTSAAARRATGDARPGDGGEETVAPYPEQSPAEWGVAALAPPTRVRPEAKLHQARLDAFPAAVCGSAGSIRVTTTPAQVTCALCRRVGRKAKRDAAAAERRRP